MADKSAIEWTDATWNPVRGCAKVSPGCKHCYAETFAERWRGVPGHPFEQGFDLRLVPEVLGLPLKWRMPRRVFVNSMSDLFWERVPREYVDRVFRTMLAAERHTFQVLTKRADRMRRYAELSAIVPGVLPNVWLGVSVEDRKYGLPRIDELRATPAALRFLSVEPLLEDLGELDLSGIGWVIVGGESGPKARPLDLQAAYHVVEQCERAGVACFVKQLGSRWARAWGTDAKGGVLAEFPPPLRVREFPKAGRGALEGGAP